MALELGGRWRACVGHHPAQQRLHSRAAPLRRPARAARPPRCQLDGAGLGSSGGGSGSSSAGSSGGERLPLPRKSGKLEPSLYLSPEDAVIAQLKVRVGLGVPRRRSKHRRSNPAALLPCCSRPVPPSPAAAAGSSAQLLPLPDHGIEVMYRFSAFDPFTRCDYFGRTLDLGQVRGGDVPPAAATGGGRWRAELAAGVGR